MTPVRLEPAALRSRVKHSTSEPLRSQIWCVSCPHEWGVQRHNFFYPAPWGRAKRSNIIRSISKIFKPNWDFHSVAWVAPGVGLGGIVGGGGGVGVNNFFILKFNQIWCVSYLHEWHMQHHNFWGSRTLGPWGGAKRSNIIKNYKVNFKDF